jgi:S-methylmethionine-dependent homocysteine/selenocysteine methylase
VTAVTILDGGMGKELRRIGAPFRQPEWSSLALIEAPDRVVEAHRNFIEAGAQVITTNNYAVVPYHHAPGFFDDRGLELTALAGRLARTAADAASSEVRVAGSMPPLFGSYEPSRFDALPAAPIYADIARALDPFVDIWLGETLSTIAEMRTIVHAVADLPGDRPTWMSFAVPDVWTDGHIALRSGESMDDIVDALVDGRLPISAILINCSIPEQTGPALAALRAARDRRGVELELGAYANAFPTARSSTYQANEVIFERRTELTADRYADFVADWVAAGATLVGGCCDMYPEHIQTLADRFG